MLSHGSSTGQAPAVHLTQDTFNLPIQTAMAANSGSSLQLVGGAPPVPEGQEGGTDHGMPRASMGRPHRHPLKARPMRDGEGADHPPCQNSLG